MPINKYPRKMTVIIYAMKPMEIAQVISVLPKEGKRIINQFKATGKISYHDIARRREIELEPYTVTMAHISDSYFREDK